MLGAVVLRAMFCLLCVACVFDFHDKCDEYDPCSRLFAVVRCCSLLFAVSLAGMDSFPIRDPDLSTVLLEMIGVSDNDVAVLFGVQKRECAMAIHQKVQRVVIEENPPSALFKPTQQYDIDESDSSNKEKAMQYSNGMFFSSSVFLEQILILATGSGLFSSASMSAVEMNMISAGT